MSRNLFRCLAFFCVSYRLENWVNVILKLKALSIALVRTLSWAHIPKSKLFGGCLSYLSILDHSSNWIMLDWSYCLVDISSVNHVTLPWKEWRSALCAVKPSKRVGRTPFTCNTLWRTMSNCDNETKFCVFCWLFTGSFAPFSLCCPFYCTIELLNLFLYGQLLIWSKDSGSEDRSRI